MRKVLWCIMATIAPALACVGEAAVPTPAAVGDLNGPCFANGTCNAPLSCGVVKGVARCVPVDDAAAPVDASGDVADASRLVCSISPPSYPCSGSDSYCFLDG